MKTTLVGTTAVALAAVAYTSPAIASIGAVRRQLWPKLAGIGDPHHVALTFDDGPDPLYTPRLLRLLDALDVKATFFLLGTMLARSPQLGRDLVAAGHEIGVHGWEHRLLAARGPRATLADITRARDLIEEVTGVAVRWWRPPYGVLTTSALGAAHRLRLTPVLWTAWGRDWTSTATRTSVTTTVERALRPGGTILLHDSDCTSAPGSSGAMLEALPGLVTRIRSRGLMIGPLRDHMISATSAPSP